MSIRMGGYAFIFFIHLVMIPTDTSLRVSVGHQCIRELLQALSRAEAFEQHANKLQAKLYAMLKDKTPVLSISPTPAKVDLIQETTNAKKCTAEQPLSPSGSTVIPQNVVKKETPNEVPFIPLTKNIGLSDLSGQPHLG